MAVIDLPVTEVSEEEAQGTVKATYEDIKQTLRTPMVSPVFRTLATNSDVLVLAWRQLKPNVQTIFFEERADAIRRFAVTEIATFGAGPQAPNSDAESALRVFHYVDPKVLLAVAVLRAAANGQVPRLEELPSAAKRQIASGIPMGAATPATVAGDPADPALAGLFERLRGGQAASAVGGEYRALAAWPAYLEQAVTGLEPLWQRAEYVRMERALRRMADETTLMLPFRVDMNPHTLRLVGCSEQELDLLRQTLDGFYRLLSGVVLNVSYLASGAFGPQAAAESPFPAVLAATA